MTHKIPLPELGMVCEKKEIDNIADYDNHGNKMISSGYKKVGYNTRTSENAKSVLAIDNEKAAIIMFNKTTPFIMTWEDLSENIKEIYRERIKVLSQNANLFMRIEKGQ